MESRFGLIVISLFLRGLSGENVLQCDFDFEDPCGFATDVISQLSWELNSGSTRTDHTGPDADHTTGTGYYFYMESSGAKNGELARLESPKVYVTMQTCVTISFYYYMYGEDIGTLNVNIALDSTQYPYENPAWGLNGDQGKGWKKAEINVTLPENFRVVFDGIAKLGIFDNTGDIAIDDFRVDTGNCELLVCDPTISWCQNGGTCMEVTDDTSPNDYYVCNCSPGWEGTHCDSDVDECKSNPCQNDGVCTHGVNSYQCFCVLGYHGNNCEYIDQCISQELHRCGNGGTCIPNGNEYNCTCMPGYSGNFCDVNIDECVPMPCVHGSCNDLVNSYSCSCETGWSGYNCELLAGECTFDMGADACKYSTTPIVDYMWEEMTGSTPNFGTGPDRDHTTGDGMYMYADASSRDQGERALLYSPMLSPATIGVCTEIKFWYYMYGNTIGTLNVYASGTGNNELETNPILTITGEQENQWMSAEIELSSSVAYSITFETVAKSAITYRGDIAIDDVTIHPDTCAYLHCSGRPCQNGGTCFEDNNGGYTCGCSELWTGENCTEDSNLCLQSPCQNGGTCNDVLQDYICECDSMHVGRKCEYWKGSCDFEDPYLRECGYEDDATGQFFWETNTGKTPSAQTGPDNDHTTESTGYYLYADATDRTAGQNARIKAPTVPGSGRGCTQLSFWYYMFGASVGQLAVHLEFEDEPLANPIWTKKGGDRMGWTNVKINISVPQDYRLVFEATMEDKSLIDSDNRGDIAIDDVEIFTDVGCSYDACFVQPCLNGGTCIVDDASSFTCLCPNDYGGTVCQIYEPCQPNPCKNGGICEIGVGGIFECFCQSGYIGQTCSKIDYCVDYPCQNDATCVSEENTYNCTCVDGYEGVNCEHEIDECLVYKPCLNGGTCTDQLNSYSCDCLSTFVGANCEKVLGSCSFKEQSFCNWVDDALSDFNWMTRSGPSCSFPFSGPQTDHTPQSIDPGYYILTCLSHDNPKKGDLFRIRSPNVRLSDYTTNVFKVELYYYMKGDDIGIFNIFIQEFGKQEYSIYQLQGDQGNKWQKFSSTIEAATDWAIILEHRIDKNLLFDFGDVAVDDITISLIQQPETTSQTDTSIAASTQTATTTSITTSTAATTRDSKATSTALAINTTRASATMTTGSDVNNPPSTGGGLDGGAVAGIVIGTLFGMIFVVGLVYWLIWRPKQQEIESQKQLYTKTYNVGVDNPSYSL